MRFNGTPLFLRAPGIARNLSGVCDGHCGLGALPENLQNPLYPPGSVNSNYNDVINTALWDALRAAVPRVAYHDLPTAGPGQQTPWGPVAAGAPPAVIGSGTVPAVGAGGGGSNRHVNISGLNAATIFSLLSGLGDAGDIVAAFPYNNKQPDITGNVFWYTGQPQLNVGAPRFANDAAEWLRHAVVDSNWDDVEVWMAWALNNGMSPADLTRVNFGDYKFVSGAGGTKKYFPFSEADYKSFFDRFMKYASNVKVDRDCLQSTFSNYQKAVRSSPRNSFRLNLSNCPLTTPWYIGLMRAVAVIAIPYAIATVGAALAAGAATASGTGAGAAAAAGGTGAAGSAGAALIPAGLEVVTVTAAPIIGATTGAAIGASAIAAGAAAAAAQGTIETVTTTSSALPSAPSVGQALTAGAVAVAAAPPALLPPSIETVTVEAPRIDAHPVSAAETAATGLTAVGITYPAIELTPPQAPEYSDSTLKSNLQDAAESLGADYLKNHLQEWLANQLGREPTPNELQQYEDYLEPDSPGAMLRKALPWIALAVVVVVALKAAKKRRKKS